MAIAEEARRPTWGGRVGTEAGGPHTWGGRVGPEAGGTEADSKGVYRPTTDHSRTGLNAHTDLSFLRHSLQTYDEIAYFLQTDYFMRMSDVEDAFPMLPLHPDVWPYFMYRFYLDDTSDTEGLFLNSFAAQRACML